MTLRICTLYSIIFLIFAVQYGGVDSRHTREGPESRPINELNINQLCDELFADLRQYLSDNGFDPLPLPSDEDTFQMELFNRTINGSVWLGDGAVTGLSTLHREGNMTVEFKILQTTLSVAGLVSFTGFKVEYSGSTEVGPFGSDFTVNFNVPSLVVDFLTKDFNQTDNVSSIMLEHCYLQDFRYAHVDLKGFGPLDTALYEVLGNSILQILNDRIQEGVESVVCSVLENALENSGQRTLLPWSNQFLSIIPAILL